MSRFLLLSPLQSARTGFLSVVNRVLSPMALAKIRTSQHMNKNNNMVVCNGEAGGLRKQLAHW